MSFSSKKLIESAIAVLMDAAPKLPPNTRSVFFEGSRPKLFNASSLLIFNNFSLTGVPVNFSLDLFLKYFFEEKEIQLIWQTGKNYFSRFRHLSSETIIIKDFIEDMNFAYSASNLVIARAGATTIAELLTLAIPAALVPSPNVAANHQYYNAKSLADQNAAILVEDHELKDKVKEISLIIFDEQKLNDLKQNAERLSKPDAAELIAESAIRLAEAK